MASDFAIAQFRFLVDLLLVHGRWSYLRISKIIGYFFYKNTLFTLTQFWFNCFAGFSGQRFYDDWYQSAYNVLFTSVPVIVIGLFDQDVNRAMGKAFPQLYMAGQKNIYFNVRALAWWILTGMFQSVICFFLPILAGHPAAVNEDGHMIGHWALATTVYTCVIITVNCRLALAVSFHTIFHHVFIWGSILFWYLFIFIYCAMTPGTAGSLDSSDNIYYVIYYLVGTPSYWFSIILTPVVCLLPDILMQGMERWFRPLDHQIIQEWNAKQSKGFTAYYPSKGKTTQPGKASPFGNQQIYPITRGGLTQDGATQLAQKTHAEITQHEMKLRAALPGDNIMASTALVRLTGTGTAFDQDYYVESVKRSMSVNGGYGMSIAAKNHNPESVPSP